jgi:hypothetical protein
MEGRMVRSGMMATKENKIITVSSFDIENK